MNRKTLIVEIPEDSLTPRYRNAFGGVFTLGLLCDVTEIDKTDHPDIDPEDVRNRLIQAATDCADGLAGIGALMTGSTVSPTPDALSALGMLIENLGWLAHESLERLEAFEHRQAHKSPKRRNGHGMTCADADAACEIAAEIDDVAGKFCGICKDDTCRHGAGCHFMAREISMLMRKNRPMSGSEKPDYESPF